MPESIDEYIQQTGRAGRDGELTLCYLFYRHEDRTTLCNVKCGGRGTRAFFSKIDRVALYALNGSMCRREALARSTLMKDPSQASCSETGSILCDNCQNRASKRSTNIELMGLLNQMKSKFLSENNNTFDEDKIDKEVTAWRRCAKAVMPRISSNPLLLKLLVGGRGRYSVVRELINFILLYATSSQNGVKDPKTRSALIEIVEGAGLNLQLQESLRLASLSAPSQAETVVPTTPADASKDSQTTCPLLVRYCLTLVDLETKRKLLSLYHQNKAKAAHDILANDAGVKKHIPFRRLLASRVSLTATPTDTYDLANCLPEVAHDCRMFRKFGAERFLIVRVKRDVKPNVVSELHEKTFLGRKYKHLWIRKDKDPQQFVLFAEEGEGLETVYVKEVREWSIPSHLNKDLTTAQFMKRMKLLFSETTPSAVLPPQSVEVLPNFDCDDIQEFDGCGLISQSALDLVWSRYEQNAAGKPSGHGCPYSGFQGRLGGFKGAWVLDPSLPGIKIQCRESQRKFNVPMKCLREDSVGVSAVQDDDSYSTMEVCSWDEAARPAKLNVRFIQLLEHYSVSIAFFEENCLRQVREDLSLLSGEGEQSEREWLRRLDKRQHSTGDDSTDSRRCWKMCCAGIPAGDPEKRRCQKKLLDKMLQSCRDKAHYDLPGCTYLRMYADHTLLLNEGEAFVACDLKSDFVREVVAMRSPSYFAGDLRRLKLASWETLRARAETSKEQHLPKGLQRSPAEKIEFFKNLRHCIVLSNKGARAEADKMSGGDYDGDKALVCWNEKLLEELDMGDNPAEDVSDINSEKSAAGQKVVWEATVHEEIRYALEARPHPSMLGRLSENLDTAIDKFGFDSDVARRFGRASFLQVDVPDKPLMKLHELSDLSKQLQTTPDWKLKGKQPTAGTHRSDKILGHLYRALEENKEKVASGLSTVSSEIDHRVLDLCKEFSKFTRIYNDFAKAARAAIEQYLHDRGTFLAGQRAAAQSKRQNATAAQSPVDEDTSLAERLEWQQSYYEKKRDELFHPKRVLEVVGQKFRAALFYKIGFEEERRYREKRSGTAAGVQNPNSGGPMEFVWGVADDILMSKDVFCSDNAVMVSGEALHHVSFQKKQAAVLGNI